jgi:hypothetical protein
LRQGWQGAAAAAQFILQTAMYLEGGGYEHRSRLQLPDGYAELTINQIAYAREQINDRPSQRPEF